MSSSTDFSEEEEDIPEELFGFEDGEEDSPSDDGDDPEEPGLVCPICNRTFRDMDERKLTEHIDECLARGFEDNVGPTFKSTSSPVSTFKTHSSSAFAPLKPTLNSTPNPVLLNTTLKSPRYEVPEIPTFQANPPSHSSSMESPSPFIVWSKSACSQCKVIDGHLGNCSLSRSIPFNSLHNNSFSSIPTPFSVPTSSPRGSIKCCYKVCPLTHLEPREFAIHAVNLHVYDDQKHSCPICSSLGFGKYTVNEKTNLLEHLQSVHLDLLIPDQTLYAQEEDEVLFEEEDEFIYNPEDFARIDIPVTLPDAKSVGSTYIEMLVETELLGKECPICFDEFIKDAAIVRMDCFCVFHKTCIDSWFQKLKKCPLHKD